MEPNQNQNQPLDPSVVALTKAIGKAESGGKYGATSMDKGSPKSAYGFTPDFIKNNAPKYLGSNYDPSNLTPAQQDQLAYGVVQDWGKQGLNPAQIASKWNTGQPDSYLDPNYGKNNAYGSTKNYVDEVAKHYHEAMGMPQQQSQSQPQEQVQSGQPRWLTTLEGLGMGAVGWLGAHGLGLIKGGLPAAGTALGSELGPAGMVAGGMIGKSVADLIPGDSGNGNQDNAGGSSTASPSQPPNSQNQSNLDQELPKSAEASNAVKNAIMQSLGTTQSNRVFSQSPKGEQAVNTTAQYGLLQPDEEGNLSFNENKRQELVGNLADLEKKFVTSEGKKGQMMSVLNSAGEYLGKNSMLAPDKKQHIADLVGQYARAYAPSNGSMDLGKMVEARHQQYAATKGKYGTISSDEIEARKALAFGFRDAVRKNVDNKDLYERVLKEEENLLSTRELKKRLHGKKAIKEHGMWETFLRQASKSAEIYIGDRLGGPIGAIIGGLAGDVLNNKLDRKFGRNIFETKGMRAALDILHDTKPDVYDKLLQAFEKEGISVHPKEIKASKNKTVEGLIKRSGDKLSIEETDALVNEVKQEKMGKKGLIERPSKKRKPK